MRLSRFARGATPHAAHRRRTSSSGYVLPNDFMYFLDFLSPIREAFFLTASVGRRRLEPTSAVARLGKSFRSCLMSSFDHNPLTSFFLAILRLLTLCLTSLPSIVTPCSIVPTGAGPSKQFFVVPGPKIKASPYEDTCHTPYGATRGPVQTLSQAFLESRRGRETLGHRRYPETDLSRPAGARVSDWGQGPPARRRSATTRGTVSFRPVPARHGAPYPGV